MIGRNIALIFSRVPCLSPRNVQYGNNEEFFLLQFTHVYIFFINDAVKTVLFPPHVCFGGANVVFVMKDSPKPGVPLIFFTFAFICNLDLKATL